MMKSTLVLPQYNSTDWQIVPPKDPRYPVSVEGDIHAFVCSVLQEVPLDEIASCLKDVRGMSIQVTDSEVNLESEDKADYSYKDILLCGGVALLAVGCIATVTYISLWAVIKLFPLQ